jgi:hypothetical protein
MVLIPSKAERISYARLDEREETRFRSRRFLPQSTEDTVKLWHTDWAALLWTGRDQRAFILPTRDR